MREQLRIRGRRSIQYVVRLSTWLIRHRKAVSWYGLLALLAIIMLATLGIKLSTERYIAQVQDSRTYLLQLQNQYNDIMQPNQIELGQQDLSVDYVLSQLKADSLYARPPRLPSELELYLNTLPHHSSHISAINQLSSVSYTAEQLGHYHYAVIHAIGSLLEYNPRGDLSDARLSDAEIQLRIDNAQDGLQQAQQELSILQDDSVAVSDPGLSELQQTINQVLRQLEVFDSSRKKDDWYSVIDSAQHAIIRNRQTFWQQHTEKLFADITTTNENLSQLQNDLQD